jgi:[acyl-carrier-protein] S-malonyltransferase
MDIAFLFPGQGAQFPGMARDLHEHSPEVRRLFEIASTIAGKSMEKLLFEGSDEELKQTDNTQIAITLANLAARAVLMEFGITPSRSAGFSLGEYAGFVDAGVLSPEDAFTLVLHRGTIMERVSRSLDDEAGPAGMSAVMGKDLPEVLEILAETGLSDVYPSLYNSPLQTVVGGRAAALTAAAEQMKAAGVRKVIPLKVSGPFHTPLMAPAREQFSDIACDIPFRDPLHPVYSNVTGGPVTDGEEARALCLDQLVKTVMWTSEERRLLEDGLSGAPDDAHENQLFLEVGPGSVLQGLWNAIGKTQSWPVGRFRTAGTLPEIESIAKELEYAD